MIVQYWNAVPSEIYNLQSGDASVEKPLLQSAVSPVWKALCQQESLPSLCVQQMSIYEDISEPELPVDTFDCLLSVLPDAHTGLGRERITIRYFVWCHVCTWQAENERS